MKLTRRKWLSPLVPVASMGDIAFLLIIFFMITTNFVKESGIEYTQAQATDIKELDEIPISVIMDKEGKIYLQGELIELESLEVQVRDLVAGMEKRQVMLKIDKDIPHEKYSEVFLALSRADVVFSLVGDRVEKEKNNQ